MGHKGTARDEKEQACSQRRDPEVENLGEPIHLIFARINSDTFSKEKY
jgi:hypothetical protein